MQDPFDNGLAEDKDEHRKLVKRQDHVQGKVRSKKVHGKLCIPQKFSNSNLNFNLILFTVRLLTEFFLFPLIS